MAARLVHRLGGNCLIIIDAWRKRQKQREHDREMIAQYRTILDRGNERPSLPALCETQPAYAVWKILLADGEHCFMKLGQRDRVIQPDDAIVYLDSETFFLRWFQMGDGYAALSTRARLLSIGSSARLVTNGRRLATVYSAAPGAGNAHTSIAGSGSASRIRKRPSVVADASPPNTRTLL